MADGRALVEAALRFKPDLIVLDISMPHLSGILAARPIKINRNSIHCRRYIPSWALGADCPVADHS